jgi:hypothetical protein
MRNYSKKTNSKSSFYRLIAATLTISGVSSLLPYLAIAQVVPPTPANTQILNRASGTYVDPNNPGTTINTTSNTVTVTVAEVAGITNVPAGIIDVNGGSVSLGDVVNFDFLVTNTGNAPSNIVFPEVANITTMTAILQVLVKIYRQVHLPPPHQFLRVALCESELLAR